MRGDRPHDLKGQVTGFQFTPHARGSTSRSQGTGDGVPVYPACLFPKRTSGSLPRMRGDRPMSFTSVSLKPSFTPHARGSTLVPPESPGKAFVYPACAGIDLDADLFPGEPIRLPRMRGDRPEYMLYWIFQDEFTPHARGSTRWGKGACCLATVYPACAGIDPS